jgi:protein-disulfide isomerase
MRFWRSWVALVLLVVLAMAPVAVAQGGGVVNINRDKQMALRPPTGAKVAIVMFEDLQCPDCSRAHPIVYGVAKTQNIPVVRHDFPLAQHNWAFQAAVIARYFDSKAKKLGDEFRNYIYQNQPAITPENLNSYAEKFAQANGTSMPFVLDPGKKLEAKVKADYALGQKVGVQHTPTIWVVGATKGARGEPFVEVVDRSRLSQMIDDMRRKVESGQ